MFTSLYIDNNNPLHLRYSNLVHYPTILVQPFTVSDCSGTFQFSRFSKMEHGFTAAFLELRAWFAKASRMRRPATISQVIEFLCPNDPPAVDRICNYIKLDKRKFVTFPDKNIICILVWGSAIHLNGLMYPDRKEQFRLWDKCSFGLILNCYEYARSII